MKPRTWILMLVASCIASALAFTPPALASSWTTARLPGPAGKVFLLGVSCPSQGLCVAVGTNNLIASSTDPTGGSSAWRFVYAGEGPWPKTENWPTEEISGRQIQSVSCPSANLCVAVTDQGFIYSSSDPTGPASSWNVAQVDDGKGRNTHLFGVSCPTPELCVAVSGKRSDQGKIFTTTDPTGPAGAWNSIELGEQIEFRGISCGSTSLCVAVADDGRIVTSTNPRGEASDWHVIGGPAGPGSLRAVACVAPALCLGGNETGSLLSSTNPSAGASSWSEADGGGSVQITGVSCPSASECIAVDDNGDVLTSTEPSGGAAAWSFTNVLPFTSEEGNALFAASCPSSSLCAVAGSRGKILTNSAPFLKAAVSETTPRKRRRQKRPKVKVASLLTPSRKQLEDHRGRVLIRFYSRDGARGFLCKLDQHGFRPCRSPKHYRVGVGHHVFRVRAIGYTGLRGPATGERFTIYPLCSPFSAKAESSPVSTAAKQLRTLCS
ncbi:MAG TPA: hypothetical protein VII45_03210 [Solirubrobacterales bacterium]